MQKNKGCSVYGLVETEGGGGLQCSVCWVRNSGRLPPPRGLTFHPAHTAGEQPMRGSFCSDSGLITGGSAANCCPFQSLRNPSHTAPGL